MFARAVIKVDSLKIGLVKLYSTHARINAVNFLCRNICLRIRVIYPYMFMRTLL